MGHSKFAYLVKHYQKVYQRGSKKGKGEVLSILLDLTGYNRKYITRKLGEKISLRKKRITRNKPSKYDPVLPLIKELWIYGRYPCSRRFKVMIPVYLEALIRHKVIEATEKEQELILSVSERTLDRLLKTERNKLLIRAKTGTKPGTLLKNQIPIKMWTEWEDTQPGFLEIDSVHHCGDDPSGHFCYTVSLEDVATGWHENQAHLGKSEVYTTGAIDIASSRFPFPVLGLDFDSGGEFVNYHLVRYCDKHKITYTRARLGVKNDQCYVEQSNWSQVRQYAGYSRYDTEDQLQLLNKMYFILSDYLNYFQAKERCIYKERNGARVKRRFETRTPYQRVLEHPNIPQSTKTKLKKHYLTLNPKQLLRDIVHTQKQLDRSVTN